MFRQIDNIGIPSQVSLLNGMLRELYKNGERNGAALEALSGGNAGQVLSKASSGELDTAWLNLADGWFAVPETWTYASASTVTVPAGAAGRFQKGDKIRFAQGGTVKYFYVMGAADTALDVSGGMDYTVANAAIHDIYVSRIENPSGFPGSFGFLPTIFGSITAGTPTYQFQNGRFSLQGRQGLVSGQVRIATKGGMDGEVRIGNMPFTPIGNTAGSIGYSSGWAEAGTKALSIWMTSTGYAVLFYPFAFLSAANITDTFAIYCFSAPFYI